jgi:acetolactate synthase-1/2/3 large subunit
MAERNQPRNGAELVVRRLREHGVHHIFGYPGGQLTPLYDALYREPAIRHILARDEQAAAFMADGYARATGKPGVCLAVCGPGVFNAATPLATAYTDSIPMLVISGQIPRAGSGLRSGYYHENAQLEACATLTKECRRVEGVDGIVPELDRAFAAMREGRPGPALYEIPLDVQRTDLPAEVLMPPVPAPASAGAPRPGDITALAALLAAWQRPIILAGGGVISADATDLLAELADRLGAPVFNTAMGKGAIAADHPCAAGLPWHDATSDLSNMAAMMSPWFAEADGALAVGCRFTQLATGSWSLALPAALAQVDIDAAELGRHYPLALGIHADAREALQAVLAVLPKQARPPWTGPARPRTPWRLPGIDLVGPLRQVLPRDAIVVADITRLAYIMLVEFPVYQPRTFLHPAGFVAMGYGLPAALGAKAAFPKRVVVAVAGDGCFLMSGMELATAVQERLAVVTVLVNDGSLTLIKAIQERRYDSRFIGVDLQNPDFGVLAQAFGVPFWRVKTDTDFAKALADAVAADQPGLIEVQLPRTS